MPHTDHQPPDEPDETGRRASAPDSGERRLLGALLRPSRNQLVVGILLALLGFAAVTQLRLTEVEASYAGLREQDLIDVLSGLTGTSQRAQTEIDRLEQQREALRDETLAREAAIEQAESEIASLSVLAGLQPVTGPGIRITITPETEPPSSEIFLDLLQYLRNAGAEAVQINGVVRVVAQSWFDQSASGLVVDGAQLSGPYVVDAIGDPHALTEGVTFLDGPQAQFDSRGTTMEVEQIDSLEITAVRDLPETQFTRPDSGQ